MKDEASGHVGYVLAFDVRNDYLANHSVQEAGGKALREYWIPADEMDAFNAAIVGPIRLTHTFQPGTT